MAVAALALVAAGCGNMSGSLAGTNQMAARDMAMSVADPSSGTTQELTDLGAFFFASGAAGGLGSAPWSAVLQPDGTYLVTATGTIMVSYAATITQADGTTTQVDKTATFTLDGQKTAHLDMDGTDVDVDVTTGETD